MVSVGSFGRTRVLNSIPKDLAPYAIDGAAVVRHGIVKQSREAPLVSKREVSNEKGAENVHLYSIESFERVSDDDFGYRFELKLLADINLSITQTRKIKDEIRDAIIADYKSTYAGKQYQTIGVDFPKFSILDGRITGRAEVMQMRVVSFKYDDKSRKGTIAVEIGAASFDSARSWARNNIEGIVRDKNIALITGEIPSSAKFYLGAERVIDGKLLEIEFETE